MNESSYPMQLI